MSMTATGSERSWAERLRALPREKRRKFLASLSDRERECFLHDWSIWARPNQLEPTDRSWVNWLVLAGRGFGKTRIGAEQVRKWVKQFPIVNLIGPTAADTRDVMVKGSGSGSAIMEVCRRDERPMYAKSNRRLVWPNGAQSLLFSAEEPERLRGPQCYKVWCDELAAWRYPSEVWEQLEFGLRLGSSPQVVVTTTPKPIKLIKELVRNPATAVTRGSTYDNKANLARNFYEKIITKYEGTRLGRQELNAELLDDRLGALWTLKAIDADRVRQYPPFLTRVVVGVDPAVSNGDDSAEWGIVVVGMGPNPNGQVWPLHFYVIDDLSRKLSPNEAAQLVVHGYRMHKADRVIAEVNNGGDLVEALLRNVDPSLAYSAVHASRGKLTRAEPIAALYEQHRVHHVGAFGALEDQMCDYVPTVSKSPDRMDALVWALTAMSGAEEQEIVIEHDDIHAISPDLDEFDDMLKSWLM
jgi:phage terminase large subunit-like protein